MQGWVVVIIALAYLTLLFAIASIGDRRDSTANAARSRPYTYAFSLAIYCTSWTFFGSVGLAAERNWEFLAIYIGPALVFLFGVPLLRRMIRLAKSERITSIADFLAARYGKSFAVASIATIIASIGIIPYIALQLRSIAGSIGLMVVQWLRILGARLIVCSDVVEANLEAARRLGAHVALNPRSVDVAAEVRKLTGDGVDLALEAAGAPQALAQTIAVTRPRGAVVCGGNQPLDASLPMAFIEDMMRKELRLNGCFMSYSAPFPGHEWTDSVQAILDGGLDMDAMISHRVPLADAADVFARIADHTLAHRKIIFLPS